MTGTKPKILLLVTSSAWGGAERYVARLAQAASSEFNVTVAAGPSRRRELFSDLPPVVRTIEIPALQHPIGPWSDLKAALMLRSLIDREGFDLVHANSSKAGLLGALAARFSRRRPPVVYTAHGWAFLERRSALFRWTLRWSEKIAARWRAATITLSKMERDVALAERLSPPRRLHVIPLGIDRNELTFLEREEARTRLAASCQTRLEPLLLGTIANAYPAKNVPMLFDAFERLASEFPNLGLVVIGDGPEMPHWKALHAALPHRDRICLPGALPRAAELLKGFDAFVLPSTKEGFPWTILEASLAEIPIVATRVGALPEIIEHGKTGFLVKPGRPEELYRALHNLFSDRGLYQELKSGAPKIAARRSGTVMTNDTLGVYRSAIRRS